MNSTSCLYSCLERLCFHIYLGGTSRGQEDGLFIADSDIALPYRVGSVGLAIATLSTLISAGWE